MTSILIIAGIIMQRVKKVYYRGNLLVIIVI
jgi:hypothetical protein